MHTLAFANQKGGCGKTTTAVNLAGALAERGDRVLLVDLDPQAHATLALGVSVEREPSMIEVLADEMPIAEVVRAAPGGIALAPSTARLCEYEEISARTLRPQERLSRSLDKVRGDYDWCVLDCPPCTEGILAMSALRAADTAVLVIETGAFALQGALKARVLLAECAAHLDRPFALRAVATMFDKRSRIARELLVGVHAQFGELLFDTAISTSVRLREAAALGVPVQALDARSRAAIDFRALAAEVAEHAAALDGVNPTARRRRS